MHGAWCILLGNKAMYYKHFKITDFTHFEKKKINIENKKIKVQSESRQQQKCNCKKLKSNKGEERLNCGSYERKKISGVQGQLLKQPPNPRTPRGKQTMYNSEASV